jgi:hypothetical protein
MQIRNRLLLLLVPGLSFGWLFASESDAWPERGTVVSPMGLESGSVIGLALSVRYVPAGGFVSRGLEYQEGLVWKI